MAPRMTAKERKTQILAAAIHLFSTQGLDGTTTKQIAERAGITEALIYKHFSGKEELYQEALKEMIKQMKSTPFFKTLFSGKSPMEIMKSGATANLKFMDDNPQFTRLLLYSGLQQNDLAKPFFESIALPFLSLLENFIHTGQTIGTIRDDIDPFLSAMPIIGSAVFFNLTRNIFQLEKFQDIEPEAFIDNLLKLFMRGISIEKEKNNE